MPQDWDGDGLLAPVSCLFSAAKAGFRSAVNRHDSSRALIQNWPSILLLRYLRIELLETWDFAKRQYGDERTLIVNLHHAPSCCCTEMVHATPTHPALLPTVTEFQKSRYRL